MNRPRRSVTQRASGPTGAQLLSTSVVLAVVVGASLAGVLALDVVDLVVLLGVGLVLPLALEGRWAWSIAALGAAASLLVPTGALAGCLTLPWLVVAGAVTVRAAGRGVRRHASIDERVIVVAAAYAGVAGVALACSRLGLRLLGVGEPIVELTAVHFTYAGCAALVLAANALRRADRGWIGVGRVAVALTAAAPIVVATGFVVHSPIAQVGGAVVMAIGVWATATLELRVALTPGSRWPVRVLLGTSGLVVWVPMLLAVAWAAGQYADVPALSIPAMVRTHGLVNSIGFVLAGLLAAWLPDRRQAGALGRPVGVARASLS